MKKLRIRFIIAAMASLLVVLGAIVTGLNLISYNNVISSADQVIAMIIQGGGVFPDSRDNTDIQMPEIDMDKPAPGGDGTTPPPKPEGESGDGVEPGDGIEPGNNEQFRNNNIIIENKENINSIGGLFRNNRISDEAPYETRYFSVYIDSNNSIIYSHMTNIASVSEDTARQYVSQVLANGKDTGFVESRYRYAVAGFDQAALNQATSEASSGSAVSTLQNTDLSGAARVIVFVDCRNNLISFFRTLVGSVVISVVGWLLVLLLVIGTSKLIFRPVEISEMRQKQFLTDASHELKTPLAIIEANTEVMELEAGETQWTKSTKNQVKRLSGLVSQMVALTRIDESELGGKPEEIDYTKVVKESVEPYIAPAKLGDKKVITDIEEGVILRGNEKNIRQLLGLLMDNSVKYSTKGTDILVGLKKHGRKTVLTVYNKTSGLPEGNNDILFERFYRADASRNSETGGSGIGLSVAKSIVERSKGKITAVNEDGESLLITVII